MATFAAPRWRNRRYKNNSYLRSIYEGYSPVFFKDLAVNKKAGARPANGSFVKIRVWLLPQTLP